MKKVSRQKILMISYYFPPIKSIGTIRNFNVYHAFQKYFLDVKVLTTKNRHRLPKEPLPINENDITEVSAYDYRRLVNFFQETTKKKMAKDSHFQESTKQNKLVQIFIKLTDSFPFNVLIGDGGLIYIVSGFFNALRLIRKNNVTHLYSSFRPYSDHMIAYWVKIFKPEIYWIADFRDVHVDPIIDNLYFKSFQHWCNRLIISKADIVTTVSKGLAKQLNQYHKNVYVLRNGIGQISEKKVKPKKYSKFTLVYTGSMFLDKRNPELLLKAISVLISEKKIDSEKINIIYAGKDGTIWKNWIQKYNLEKNFNNKGLLSLSEATSLQYNCHVNLLLTYSSPEMTGNLTGKFYEYLAAGNPVLVLVNGIQDEEFEQIIDELNAGIVVYNDDTYLATTKSFILTLYQQWLKNGEIKKTDNRQKLKDHYSWPAMMEKFMQNIMRK